MARDKYCLKYSGSIPVLQWCWLFFYNISGEVTFVYVDEDGTLEKAQDPLCPRVYLLGSISRMGLEAITLITQAEMAYCMNAA